MTRTTENTDMNTDLRYATLGALAVLCLGIAAKAITLPSYFDDGMMLQRNAVPPVAGKCRPGRFSPGNWRGGIPCLRLMR